MLEGCFITVYSLPEEDLTWMLVINAEVLVRLHAWDTRVVCRQVISPVIHWYVNLTFFVANQLGNVHPFLS